MNILAVIDTRWDTSYAKQSWQNYTRTRDAVQEKIQSEVQKYTFLGPNEEIQADLATKSEEIYAALKNAGADFDAILYVYADEPFLDAQLTKKMLENHIKYFADFSFAEGYPQGLTPMIVSTRIFDDLIELAKTQPNVNSLMRKRNFFFETIKKDLNRFSIETQISPVDVRALRIALNYQNKNNSEICNKILSSGAKDADAILETVQNRPDLLWGIPAYYNIQISSNCPQKCSYCPYSTYENFNKNIFMSMDNFQRILSRAHQLSDQAVISLSYMGEPSSHQDFPAMMRAVLEKPNFSLHIETSGLGWNEEAWTTILSLDRDRISLIISLDSQKEALYKKVRGEGFQEAMAFINRALAEFKDNTWIQSVRQKSLESELESFYRHFQELNAQTIIQKYNNFCDTLPNEKSVNIAPLKRHVCWALQREISIQVNGNVNLCASDLAGKEPLGNAFRDDLKDIWARMNEYRMKHTRGEYPKICQNCDEYYIFNF